MRGFRIKELAYPRLSWLVPILNRIQTYFLAECTITISKNINSSIIPGGMTKEEKKIELQRRKKLLYGVKDVEKLLA